MGYLLENGVFTLLSEDVINGASDFSCGHPDLDDFFHNDCIAYSKALFGKSYCFHAKADRKDIICAFTVSNASIFTNRLPNSRKKKIGKIIPFEKRDLIYPAVLIGRLGINSKYQRCHVGSELMDFIKAWCVSDDEPLKTRLMYFDLIRIID